MKTITSEQFKKLYGDAGVASFGVDNKIEVKEPGFFQRVGADWSQRADRVGEILKREDTGVIEKGAQILGQGAGAAANTFENLPVVKQGLELVGTGIQKLSETSPIKFIGDYISDSQTLQEVVGLYDTDTNFKDTVDGVANMVRLYGDAEMAASASKFVAQTATKLKTGVKNSPLLASGGRESVTRIPTQGISAGIMERVARLKPADLNKFEKMTGKTTGQYLTETGNFGAPDKVIANEAIKYTKSKAAVDAEMAKLPGVYKDGAVGDALTGLMERAKAVSSDNVPASYRSQVQDLIKRYNAGGLTMEEINTVKRLYEREVKLGYNKLLNADKVQQATNIDSAIRRWQVNKAKELGFENVSELNKQTQASRFLVDKLGEQVIGQNALNSIGLTDWIVLSGGDPTAIAGFLTKKFFSSRAVQAKIAEILNYGEKTNKLIEAKVNPTVENTMRKIYPEGTPLQLPEGTSKVKAGLNPIPQRGATTFEAPAKQIMNESMARSSTKPPQPQPQGIKSKTPSLNDMMKKRNTQGGFIDPVKMASDVKRFLKTMPEYGLLQDLKALRELYDFKVLPKGEVDKNSFMRDVRTQLEKHGVDAFNMSDLALARFADAVLIEADKVPKVKTTAKSAIPVDKLMSEAKKYKSAEEFVKKQEPIYHGADQRNIDALNKNGVKILSPEEKIKLPSTGGGNYGISMTTDKVTAKNYSQALGNKNIGEFYLNPKAKVKTISGYIDEVYTPAELENLAKTYDVIKSSASENEVRVLTNNGAVTKSQLTDIWNKANKK